MESAAEAARRLGWPFVLNPAPARPLPYGLIGACRVVTPNQHEAELLAPGGVSGLLDRGPEAVVVTRGARGADLHRRDTPVHHQDPFPCEAVDTTGAGDAFSAALAWALSEGQSLEDAVRMGCAAGALATRAVGARASLPSRKEVEAMAGTTA